MRISIIGCGWLGWPLARQLARLGYSIKASTTSPQKKLLLQDEGFEAFLLDIRKEITDESRGLMDTDLLIINIPPRDKVSRLQEDYANGIGVLANHLDTDTKLLFVSSTSVYQENNAEVTEEAPLLVSELTRAEQIVQTMPNPWVVLRLAGLAGPGRNPARWYADKKAIAGGNNPINMIHIDDCISIICQLIIQFPQREMFNACAPVHPLRKEFIRAYMQSMDGDIPELPEDTIPYKIVNCDKLINTLKYRFKYPDPLCFPC